MTDDTQKVFFDLIRTGNCSEEVSGDPSGLFDLFRRHRLFPLAMPALEFMKEEEQQKWKNSIRFRTMASMQMTAALDSFTAAFQAAGIRLIPFKGPVLAQELYGSMGERHFRDLDILAPGADIKKIIRIAGDEGYALLFPREGMSDRQWEYYLRHKKHIGLMNSDLGILVELHTGIENNVVLRSEHMARFTESLINVKLGQHEYSCMDRHYTFLYLVLHGSLHQYRRLFWLRDVADAVVRWDLDHSLLLDRAREFGIERMLGVSLLLAREYFDSPIPAGYSKYLHKEGKLLKRMQESCKCMIEGPENPGFRSRFRKQLFILRQKRGILYKLLVPWETIHRLRIGKKFDSP